LLGFSGVKIRCRYICHAAEFLFPITLLTEYRWGFQVRRFLAGKTSGNMVDELDFAEGILRVCLGEGVRDWSWNFMAKRLEDRQTTYEKHSKARHRAFDRLDEEFK
jgi:hypothetical protein